MFSLETLIDAVNLVFTAQVLMWMFVGVIIGIAVGAIPGLTAATAMAVALPLSVALPVTSALGLLMIGLYKGGIFGGSIPAILFGIPGTSESAATVYDGQKLAQQGQSRKALGMSLGASVTGDMLSDLFTIFVAPAVAVVALVFGPTERFWLVVLAVLLIGALTGPHLVKGLISAAIGVFIASIGSDPMFGVGRMTFGQWWLADGIGLIPLVVGIFAMPRHLRRIGQAPDSEYGKSSVTAGRLKHGRLTLGRALRRGSSLALGRNSRLGRLWVRLLACCPDWERRPGPFFLTVLPKQASPEKEIGSGRLEGIAAAESGNNATCGPTLIPLLAFGIPGMRWCGTSRGSLVFSRKSHLLPRCLSCMLKSFTRFS